jgi:ribosomal protein S14
MIKCDECGEKHAVIDKQHRQGSGCSSHYQRSTSRLFGHYGSTVIDMQIWKFVDGVDLDMGLINDANICDVCIQKHIDEGRLVFVKEYEW